MKLLWQIDTQVDPRYLSLMQTAADCALWMEGVSRPCAVNIRICGDDAIHEINREYRGVDRATDVLSFPTVNYPAGKPAGQCDKLLARELDDEVDACMLGDLIISMPHVLAQAAEYGHSPEREAAYLTVHGLCHLMGYDHIEDEDKKKMRAMEEKILSAIGMTRDGEMQTDVSGRRGAAVRGWPRVSGLQHRERVVRLDELRRAHGDVQGGQRGRAGIHRDCDCLARRRPLALRRVPTGAQRICTEYPRAGDVAGRHGKRDPAGAAAARLRPAAADDEGVKSGEKS